MAKEDDRIEQFDSHKTFFINPFSGEKFIKTDYCEVDAVVDDKTGFVNVTRILHKYDKRPREFIRRTENLRNLLIYAKHKHIFNVYAISQVRVNDPHIDTSEDPYHFPYLMENRDLLIGIADDRQHSLKVGEDKLMEIYAHLPFIDMTKRNKGYTNEAKGMYVHPLLIHPFAYYADIEYELKVSDLMDRINKEHHLREITLREKIKEQDILIKDLQEKWSNSNEFKSRKKGSLLIQKNKTGDNSYDIRFMDVDISDKTKFPEFNNDIVIGDIWNVHDLETVFKFYTRKGNIDFIERTTGNHYNITDMDKVYEFVDMLRKFKFQLNMDVDRCINEYLSKHDSSEYGFKGHMFEFFCWKKFGHPIFKYERTESLGITKQDKGIDLLDIPNETIGQCKWYKPTTKLTMAKLQNFINFCKDEDFNKWTKILFVNEDIIFEKMPPIGMCQLVFVSQKEFSEFLEPYISHKHDTKPIIDKVSIPDIKKNLFIKDLDEDVYQEMRKDVKDKLASVNFVYMNEMVKFINNKYSDKLSKFLNERLFGQLFTDLYQKTNHGRNIPTDEHGIKILKRAITYDDEVKWINETLKYGQYIQDELVKLHNENFLTSYSVRQYVNRFGTLFVRKLDNNGIKQVRINGDVKTVFELNLPDKNKVFKEFLDKNGSLNDFNKHFHRYESKISYARINSEIYVDE